MIAKNCKFLKNRDKVGVKISNESFIKRATRYGCEIDGTVTLDVLALFYYSKVCRYCGIGVGCKTRSIDHMQPSSKQGLHGISNLVLSCRKCNTKKANKTLVEFIIEENICFTETL